MSWKCFEIYLFFNSINFCNFRGVTVSFSSGGTPDIYICPGLDMMRRIVCTFVIFSMFVRTNMLLNDSSENVPKNTTEELHQLDLCYQSKSQNQ